MAGIDRRTFVRRTLGAGIALTAPGWLAGCGGEGDGQGGGPGPTAGAAPPAGTPEAGGEPAAAVFRHGVASGDPLPDRVILWTRVEPGPEGGDEEVEWRLARDAALTDVVASGRAPARADRDHTVKVDATGLAPATSYWYGFRARGQDSPPGRTRTLPMGPVDHFRLAFCSCSNIAFGYFNPYLAMAARDDLDVVLHLGDYIYEYANGVYGDGTPFGPDRVPRPDKECVTLADYRTRHAQYKRTQGLQAVHARHPMIAVWDDHETANDAWLGGAQNHQPLQEGEWAKRRAAAVQAWHEWLPVREQEFDPLGPPRIWRAFRVGDLAELVMLDSRLAGRDRQPESGADRDVILDPQRTLLGREQEAWLAGRLRQAQQDGVRWKLLGQQVMMGQLRNPDFAYRNPDQWDGYAAARKRLLDLLELERIEDVLVLTGDIHSSWAIEVGRDPFAEGTQGRQKALAVEFVTPAVSSPGVRERAEAESRATDILERHPHILWADLWHRGYVTVDLTPEGAQADWWHFASVEVPSADARFARAFRVRPGASRLESADGPVVAHRTRRMPGSRAA